MRIGIPENIKEILKKAVATDDIITVSRKLSENPDLLTSSV